MYERKYEPPIPAGRFVRRVFVHVAISLGVLAFSLVLGICGYEYYESLPWRDAFLNAAMLLGGMGPVNSPLTDGGKLFAGCYALYAGLIFLIVVGIVLTPVIHRIMHKFHWDQDK